MLCSVVIPWHRDLDDLRRALDSVLAQTHQEFEIIVVVNGPGCDSFDDVVRLCADARCRVARRRPGNASAARNLGIDMANGDLVFLLDADDTFLPEKLQRFVEVYRRTGFDLAFSRGMRLRGNGIAWPFPATTWDGRQPISEFFFCDGCLISATALVIAAAAKHRLLFAERCGSCEDPDLVIRAVAEGLHVEMLPDTLFRWSDERVGNRLSQMANYDERLAWIDRLGEAVTPRARAAFKARAVAQHAFPRDFARSLGQFRDAVRLGAVPVADVALFMVRGLIPSGLRRRLINHYFRRRERRLVAHGTGEA